MIDLATAKAHLRVETDAEDGVIATYLAAAKGAVEKATSKLLTQRSVTQALAGFPGSDTPIRLWNGPVVGDVVAVAYDDGAGVEQALADFRLVEGPNAELLPAYGDSWPTAHGAKGSVRITYTAGYAANDIPPELDQAVLLLTGHYYGNREAVTMRYSGDELPLGVKELLSPFRPVGLG